MLDQQTESLLTRGGAPESPIATVMIEATDGVDLTRDTRAILICQDQRTAAVLLMPKEWLDPPDAGRQLAVPPDAEGWAVMDVLIDAGIAHIEFRAV